MGVVMQIVKFWPKKKVVLKKFIENFARILKKFFTQFFWNIDGIFWKILEVCFVLRKFIENFAGFLRGFMYNLSKIYWKFCGNFGEIFYVIFQKFWRHFLKRKLWRNFLHSFLEILMAFSENCFNYFILKKFIENFAGISKKFFIQSFK